jgi:hypothetical protein
MERGWWKKGFRFGDFGLNRGKGGCFVRSRAGIHGVVLPSSQPLVVVKREENVLNRCPHWDG